ncbi:MAG: DUF4129 domain-containing protein [SAR202 cluster bacterium]|nr:DUF4129 domain-containing protein [SAR202 cluster bacterium]
MKKIILSSFFIAFTLKILFIPNVHAQSPPPHVDPSVAQSELNQVALFTYIGVGLEILEDAKYSEFQTHISQLGTANIPSEYRFMLGRYTDLLATLGDRLNNSDYSLAKAEEFIAMGQDLAALENLKLADKSLVQAKLIMADLDTATENLGDRFGIVADAIDTPISDAYEKLSSLVNKINSVWVRFKNDSNTLTEVVLNPNDERRQTLSWIGTYPVSLQFDAPEVIYPGRPMTISGTIFPIGYTEPVHSPNKPDETTFLVGLIFDKTVLGVYPAKRNFELTVMVPEYAGRGTHEITLEVQKQQVFERVQKSGLTQVHHLTPKVSLSAKQFSLIPWNLDFTGHVETTFGPLQNAVVRVERGSHATEVVSDSNGRFQGSLNLPIGAMILGSHKLSVLVEPEEPWNQAKQTTISLLAVNATSIAFVVVLVLYLITMLVLKSARRRTTLLATAKNEPEFSVSQGNTIRTNETTNLASESTDGKISNYGKQIVLIYLAVVNNLARKFNLDLNPYQTLRDLVGLVGPTTNTAFTELTSITEKILYAQFRPDANDLKQAEELSEDIQN